MRSIEAVAIWCQASQDVERLPVALRKMAERIGADIVAVTRIEHGARTTDTSAHDLNRNAQDRVVAYDAKANLAPGVGGFRTSYAKVICERYVGTSKIGTIWQARRSDFDHIPALRTPLQQRRLFETIVIPLEHHATVSDYLELHFASDVPTQTLDALALIGPTFADCWHKRVFGLMSQHSATQKRLAAVKDQPETAKPILGVENAYALSRSEYRVCLLLSHGLNNTALLDELGISLSTLRTHLRHIYAKTGVASQSELLQMLLSPTATAAGAWTTSHVA